MTYRYVRVTAEDDDTLNCPIVIDLLLDFGGEIKRGPPYAGWWGNFKSTDVLPFIAKQFDNVYALDFGSDGNTDQNERYILFNLLHGPIAVGKKFKLKENGDWFSFTVRQIVDMIDAKVLD